MELTINNLLALLKQSGVNSKKQVIDLLQNASINQLHELERDCRKTIGIKIAKEE